MTYFKAMTEAQQSYLASLAASRDQDCAAVLSARAILRFPQRVSTITASQHISALVSLPVVYKKVNIVHGTGIKIVPLKDDGTPKSGAQSESAKTTLIAADYGASELKVAEFLAEEEKTLKAGDPYLVYSSVNKPSTGFYDMWPHLGTKFKSMRFWKVYTEHGHLKAKVLVYKNTKTGYGWETTGIWNFYSMTQNGTLHMPTTCTKMDKNSVAAFGKQISFCMVCGKTLTDPQSIADGIGPICAKGSGWGW